MDKDLESLTKQVENGHGCLLREQTDQLPDADARAAFLSEIIAENKKRRTSDPSLPTLRGAVYGSDPVRMYLESDKGSWFWMLGVGTKTLYEESFSLGYPKSTRTVDCSD